MYTPDIYLWKCDTESLGSILHQRAIQDWSDYAVVKFMVRQYPVLLWDIDAEITSYSSDQINCDESGQPE